MSSNADCTAWKRNGHDGRSGVREVAEDTPARPQSLVTEVVE